MTLYHGTNCIFSEIDLSKSRTKRDFGIGFYTTTVYEQALQWAKNMYIRYGGDGIFVKEYVFTPIDDLNMLVFPAMNKEWLEFIKSNRIQEGLTHRYDVVKGSVANDNTMRTIALYVSGVYTTEMALEQLRFFKANDQISFHTQKSIGCLHFINDKEI
ncbi:MAG: DUF3990 domain-containing protein [Spirochaetaceae bacterium]|nr:DUF3990 domain-containing protein [Spirochaetaceae bacterium]